MSEFSLTQTESFRNFRRFFLQRVRDRNDLNNPFPSHVRIIMNRLELLFSFKRGFVCEQTNHNPYNLRILKLYVKFKKLDCEEAKMIGDNMFLKWFNR